MSVVTTQPEMVTSVPSTSNAGLVDGGLADYPRDGAGIDGSGRLSGGVIGGPGIHRWTS
jgi:hypothetical protein